MKFSIALFAISASAASAFVSPPAQQAFQKSTSVVSSSALAATKKGGFIATAVVGWTLAAQIASASVMTPVVVQPETSSFDSYPTSIVSLGAYVPEDSYSATDMSMPSYNIEADTLPAAVSAPSSVAASAPVKEKDPKLQAKAEAKARQQAENASNKAAANKIMADKREAKAKAAADEKEAKAEAWVTKVAASKASK